MEEEEQERFNKVRQGKLEEAEDEAEVRHEEEIFPVNKRRKIYTPR